MDRDFNGTILLWCKGSFDSLLSHDFLFRERIKDLGNHGKKQERQRTEGIN